MATKKESKKLLSIIIRECSTKKNILELLPTKANRVKAINMSAMADIEVIYNYEELR